MQIPTPHLEAKQGDFAKTVLMPGDPLRAKFIAENFLSDVLQVNGVRGMLGYTGSFEGFRVSVLASGMGVPSICIYSHELFNFYQVENIIRIGTAGGVAPSLCLGDLVVGLGACSDLDYAALLGVRGVFAPIASYELVSNAILAAKELGCFARVGNLLSSSMFYEENKEMLKKWQELGVLAVEMEAAGLYLNAAKAEKKALCICTISDLPGTNESMSALQRQEGVAQMVQLALKTARLCS